MIEEEKRKAIWKLYQEGAGINELAKMAKVAKKTVIKIIKQEGELPFKIRTDRIPLAEDVLLDLYKRCDGWTPRIHEILTGEMGIKIAYSTLTLRIRKLCLKNEKQRSFAVMDVPGQESQHDTSPYNIEINGKKMKVVASLLYYRYSKVRYLKFYTTFTKFHLKCFFHEALTYLGAALFFRPILPSISQLFC